MNNRWASRPLLLPCVGVKKDELGAQATESSFVPGTSRFAGSDNRYCFSRGFFVSDHCPPPRKGIAEHAHQPFHRGAMTRSLVVASLWAADFQEWNHRQDGSDKTEKRPHNRATCRWTR